MAEDIPASSRRNLTKRIEDIRSLINIGDKVAEVAIAFHDSLSNEFGKNEYPRKKFDLVRQQLANLKGHPVLKEQYNTLFAQAVVLVSSAFETFMNELVRDLVDKAPDIISWPDKGDRRYVRFDPNSLLYGNPTIGDLVVSALPQDVNFQDLQSTLRFLKEYLGIEIESDDLRDDAILFHATRHIIVHNNGRINPHFLRQIRETKHYSEHKDRKGADLLVTAADYAKAEAVFAGLADKIAAEVSAKLLFS